MSRRCDVVVFGGGFAGLWILDRLRAAGWDAWLLESRALGAGQSIQAQGIVHGGGKYALRGVRDFAAVEAIRTMPATWRSHLADEARPRLGDARVLSSSCHLWVPRGGLASRLGAWGLMPVIQRAGLLHARPETLPRSRWPLALRESALRVYSMAEPVLSTGTVLAALAAPHRERLLRYDPGTEARDLGLHEDGDGGMRVELRDRATGRALELRARGVILAAGAGNEALLRRAGVEGAWMQRRPLRMVLLRGELPPLFGHCVRGGKTAMTVTTHPWERDGDLSGRVVWQVGGEVAERNAARDDAEAVRDDARTELARMLPGCDLVGAEISTYPAVRAEALSADLRRPSGVHLRWALDALMVVWPTKMALAPLLAGEAVEEIARRLGAPSGAAEELDWPAPPVAADPWREEERAWMPLD